MGKFASIVDVVPEPCCVNGTWLRPFCLGHHLLFRRLALPFAGAPLAECPPEKLLTGIAICAGESYESTLAAMLEGRWAAMFAQWSKDSSRRLKKLPKGSWRESEEMFRAYLTDGYADVPVWKRPPQEGAIKLTAPWEEILKCKLVGAGFGPSFVLNQYLPATWYDYFTVCEAEQLGTIERMKLAGVKNSEREWRKVFFTRDIYLALHPEERTTA